MAKRLDLTKNTLKVKVDKLRDFLKNIQDLTKIDNKIHLTISEDTILIYSYVGVGEMIHAFKSHIMKTDDIFYKKQKAFDKEVSFIITEGKKFFKNISNFLDFDEDIDMKFSYNEDYFCDQITIKNKQLKLDTIGGDPSSVKFNIDVGMIEEVMDTTLADFSFLIKNEQFSKIKKMSSIETENDIFYMNVEEKVISIGENRWNLKITEVENEEYNDYVASFPKKYFNTINFTGEEEMRIYVFGAFILVLSEFSNLMISVEEHA